MSTFDQVFDDDDDLLQPEEPVAADDWGWISPGAHSWRSVFTVIAAFVAILGLASLL